MGHFVSSGTNNLSRASAFNVLTHYLVAHCVWQTCLLLLCNKHEFCCSNCRLLLSQRKKEKVWLKSHSGAALYQYPSFVILESTGICCNLSISFSFIILIKDGFWTRKMSHLWWLGWAMFLILPSLLWEIITILPSLLWELIIVRVNYNSTIFLVWRKTF